MERRDFLRAIGAGAAAAALTPLGCGAGHRRRAAQVETDPEALRRALREAVTVIGEHLAEPRAWMLSRRRIRVLVDVGTAELEDERLTVCVLSGRMDGGGRYERCLDEVTTASIARAAARIAAGAAESVAAAGSAGTERAAFRGGTRRGRAIPPPVDHGAAVEVEPSRLAHVDWIARARELARRGEGAATSRIVYRAAWLTTDDDRVWAVGEDGDRHQRLVRSRVGASFVAWHGTTPQFGETEVAGGFGPAVERVDDAAIARAAAEALALFTPGAPPTGRHVVLLDPGVVAAMIDGYARSPAAAAVPANVPPFISITDDPTAAGYARAWFDDAGAPARARTLIGAGAGAGGGHVRRAGPSWRARAAPTQLFVAAGPAPAAALESGIDDGLVIEGLRDVRVDDRGMIVARVARGRQLTGGVRTGRQWGDLEVRGTAAELLADAIGVSSERREVAFNDDRRGDGTPRSVTAPWMLTRAHVGSARGPA